MRIIVGYSFAGTLSLALAVPAFGQGLEEIVVTATRREESLQDVAIAVTVVSGAMVQEGGFADIEDLSSFLPNLQIQDGFQGQTLLIRGIGTDTRNEAFEQAVRSSATVFTTGATIWCWAACSTCSGWRSCGGRSRCSQARARRPVRSIPTAAGRVTPSTAT